MGVRMRRACYVSFLATPIFHQVHPTVAPRALPNDKPTPCPNPTLLTLSLLRQKFAKVALEVKSELIQYLKAQKLTNTRIFAHDNQEPWHGLVDKPACYGPQTAQPGRAIRVPSFGCQLVVQQVSLRRMLCERCC